MPTTITNIMDSGAELGMGSTIGYALFSAAPVPGDFILVNISTTGTTPPGNGFAGATVTFTQSHALGNFSVPTWIGVNRNYEGGTQPTTMQPLQDSHWPSDGESVYVYLQFIHNFAEVCHDQTLGFVWRHAAGQGSLVSLAFDGLRGLNSNMSEVLAAVQRTVTVPGQR